MIMVTKDEAMVASNFTFKIQNPNHKAYGQLRNCRRSGKTQIWKTRPNDFKVPVKYGLYESFYITQDNADQFTVGSI